MRTILKLLILFTSLSIAVKAQDSLSTVSSTVEIAKPIPKLVKTSEALGISAKTKARLALLKSPPINIALFAVDRRNKNDEGNSDVIMVISVDPVSKRVKMSSILRDTYVNIEGKGMDKINSAFAFGGAQLAIKTINQNLAMDIKDYINVDFFSAAKIVDALGGVDINIKPEEIPYLNNYLHEIAILDMIPEVPVKSPGMQKLSGKQTVAYTRIRGVGRGDYERTERQRSVLVALFSKMQGAGPAVFPVFMSQILPNLETSMDSMTLFGLGSNILNSKSKGIEQARFPLDSSSKGVRINNIWYLQADLNKTAIALQNFIYKNINPGK
jgi:LCP family protein required for cell wall assembly